MKVNIRLAAAIAVAVTLATPALAQRPQQTPEERAAAFDKADANKDGKLDKAEFAAMLPDAMKDRADTIFAARDTDKDGKISKAEFTAPMQRPAQ
jgi:Ca2+-binding EF-hand superfamily protein